MQMTELLANDMCVERPTIVTDGDFAWERIGRILPLLPPPELQQSLHGCHQTLTEHSSTLQGSNLSSL